jgi:hypothetical protein
VGLVEQTIVGLISALGRAFVISSFGWTTLVWAAQRTRPLRSSTKMVCEWHMTNLVTLLCDWWSASWWTLQVHADASAFKENMSKKEVYEQVLEQARILFDGQRNWVRHKILHFWILQLTLKIGLVRFSPYAIKYDKKREITSMLTQTATSQTHPPSSGTPTTPSPPPHLPSTGPASTSPTPRTPKSWSSGPSKDKSRVKSSPLAAAYAAPQPWHKPPNSLTTWINIRDTLRVMGRVRARLLCRLCRMERCVDLLYGRYGWWRC